MSNLSYVNGLWVPAADANRISSYGTYAGIPDLDIRKSSLSSAICSTFDLALDIGAHIGAVASFLADRFDRVVAFEPVPDIFSALSKNVESLPNVRAVNVGVAGEPGELFFEYLPKHTQLAHVHLAGALRSFKDSVLVGPIEVVTIDSFKFENVSFMKIDVEGLELPVLEGARQTIEKFHPVILIEQAGNEEKYFERPRFEASMFLESLGMARVDGMPFNNDRVYQF